MNRRDFIKRAGTATMAAAIMNPTELLAQTEGNMNDIEIQPETKNVGEVSSAKKVLLINGSPRRNGNTATALQEVAKALNAQGIETEIAWIGNKPVRGCIACGSCKRKGNGKCVFDDDICNPMIEKMNEADGLVVGAPVYYGVPAGQMLSLIQRMLFAGAQVQNKPVAAVSICRRGGASAAFQTLTMPFQMMNMRGYFAVLEHCLRNESGRGGEGRRGYADDADDGQQYGLDAEVAEAGGMPGP